MEFYDKTSVKTAEILNTSLTLGLTSNEATERLKKHGPNLLTKTKRKNFIQKVIDALKEPMLIILIFGFIIAFGSSLGEFLKTKKADFTECVGILVAISLSVFITLFMEGSSEKAFNALRRIYDDTLVSVIRDGVLIKISQRNVVVGDVLVLENGDKIVCDGRIIESNELKTDESALTGESVEVHKNANLVCSKNTALAERYNFVYSGSFVCDGSGKIIVTATGDQTELGLIAKELKKDQEEITPLKAKLGSLGKVISIIGLTISLVVFICCFIRLSFSGALNFNSVRELFLSCVVLIVAVVPEGLPTIVAVSLALNMIKLAGENALIKKMSATETAGAVSVICSDKTGTITQNKMTVERFFTLTGDYLPEKIESEYALINFACNTTAEISKDEKVIGSATEKALIYALRKNKKALSLSAYRTLYPVVERVPFTSERKYSSTTVKTPNGLLELVKGAPEVLAEKLSDKELVKKIETSILKEKNKARRVICFIHKIKNETGASEYVYDGFVSIVDPVRPEVKEAVKKCKRAGIKVKILTGDSLETARAVALELGVLEDKDSVVLSKDLEGLSKENLKKALQKITVVARSTPLLKLKIVEALKETGEVVAVTGDGINDAPALKKADVGFAMGKAGTEIAKESADVVLLDDGFLSVVKAISFGRNVYLNIRRFITFQLSVNFSALIYVTFCVIMGAKPPFNTLQLLWINLIMDGPPALTLGLSKTDDKLMNLPPIKRQESIINKGMLFKIAFSAIFTSVVMILQETTNFLGANMLEKKGASFTLFIFFQLFNAFNCTSLGSDSMLSSLKKNKIMFITFFIVFIAHLVIVEFFGGVFGVNRMCFSLWLKIFLTALSTIVITEAFKFIYRRFFKQNERKIKIFAKKTAFNK